MKKEVIDFNELNSGTDSAVLTYKYMWQYVGDDAGKVHFQIISATPSDLVGYEKRLCSSPNIKKVLREYLHEYRISLIGTIEVVCDASEVVDHEA